MPIYAHHAGSLTANDSSQAYVDRPISRSTVRPTLLLAGLATAGFFAAMSLVASAAFARAVTGSGTGILAIVILATGTLAGAGIGSWLSQPAVTRFVMRRLHRR